MATGLVYGRLVTPTGAPAAGVLCVLDHVLEVGSGARRSGGLPITARAPRVACPPYGIGADTDANGRYVLVYDWGGMYIGEQVAQCRFRVMSFSTDRLAPHRGSAHRVGGVIGVDLRALISSITPLDSFAAGSDGASVWLNLIADRLRTLPRASGLARGMLGDRLSTESYVMATRIDFRVRA